MDIIDKVFNFVENNEHMIVDPNCRYQTKFDMALSGGRKEVFIFAVDAMVRYTGNINKYKKWQKTGNLPKKYMKKTVVDFLDLYEKIC